MDRGQAEGLRALVAHLPLVSQRVVEALGDIDVSELPSVTEVSPQVDAEV